MTIFRKAGAAAALAAMVLAMAPAQAQWHGPPHHRGHRDGIDGGDVLLGAVLAGGLFAILSSAKKHPAPSPEAVADEDRGPPAAEIGPDRGNRTVSIARSDEEAAVDACVSSAESEGRRYARIAKIDTVRAVDPDGTGWLVHGTLALRDDYRAPATDHRGFSCRIGDQGVDEVTIDGAQVAAR